MASIPVWEPNPSDPLDSECNSHHLVNQTPRNVQVAVLAPDRKGGIDCEVGDPNRIGNRSAVENNADDSKWLGTLVTREKTLRRTGWNIDPDLVFVLGNCRRSRLRNDCENTFAPERLQWIKEEKSLNLRSPVPRDGCTKHDWIVVVHLFRRIRGIDILSKTLDPPSSWLTVECS